MASQSGGLNIFHINGNSGLHRASQISRWLRSPAFVKWLPLTDTHTRAWMLDGSFWITAVTLLKCFNRGLLRGSGLGGCLLWKLGTTSPHTPVSVFEPLAAPGGDAGAGFFWRRSGGGGGATPSVETRLEIKASGRETEALGSRAAGLRFTFKDDAGEGRSCERPSGETRDRLCEGGAECSSPPRQMFTERRWCGRVRIAFQGFVFRRHFTEFVVRRDVTTRTL